MRELIARLEQSTCVSAGAGAGKTTCLINAYLGLLSGLPGRAPLWPEQIVAITFTDKAAQEMRQRVTVAVAQRARQCAAGPDWAALLPRLGWAPISTIHSFCAALLREFGGHLGLDPQFTVLEAKEFEALQQEVIAEVLRARLEERSPALARLLEVYPLAGRGSLSEILACIQAELANQGLNVSEARQATAQAHDQALALWPQVVKRLGRVVELLHEGLAAGRFNAQSGYGAKITELNRFWHSSQVSLAKNVEQYELLDDLARILGGNWNKAKELKDQAQTCQQELAALASLPAAAAQAGDLLSLASQVEQALGKELSQRAALSFDHLLLLALRLLRQEAGLRAQLRRRWQAFLVDEYQDINPVQGRLVDLLAGLEEETSSTEGARQANDAALLLLVGDRKQSIYAFRGADVNVFSQALARFQTGAGYVAFLKENFRARRELVKFYNRLFPLVFAQKNSTESASEGCFVHYLPDDQQTPGRQEPASLKPALEVLNCCHLGDERTSLARWRQLEASAISSHLRGLVEDGWAPGDMVVLLRRLTQVEVYERALAAAGLDYYTVGGRGFYQCQEVGDLLLALRALLDPQDGLALAGLLRSPLWGLSDETLFCLCQASPPDYKPRRGLIQALQEASELPAFLGEEQLARWRAARQWLESLRPLTRRLTSTELLGYLIDSTDLIPVWLGTSSGTQRVANLRKLIELARDSRLAGAGVENFCRRLQELVDAPLTEDAQATLVGEEANVIRLMSIHQAKGLEFKLVTLADLAFRPRNNTPLLSPQGVMGLKALDPAGGSSRHTPLSQQLCIRQRTVEQAEAARLFYVAVTRARERLVLCLHGASLQNQGYWGRWLKNYVLPDPLARVITVPPLENADRRSLAARWPAAPPAGKTANQEKEAAAVLKRCLQPRLPALAAALVSESVNGLEDWLTCPRRYFFTRRLNLDTTWLAIPTGLPGTRQGGAGIAAADLGRLVHLLLELSDLAWGPASLEAVLAGLELAPEATARAQRLAAGWWHCGLPQMLADLGPGLRLLREQGFSLMLKCSPGGPDLEIIGKFDLLALPDQGAPLLVDYKVTSLVEPDKYLAQMALYSLALWPNEQTPPPRVYLCYLNDSSSRIVDVSFTPSELLAWRQKALQAGRDLAQLPLRARPQDLPVGTDCGEQSCPLQKAKICAGTEGKR